MTEAEWLTATDPTPMLAFFQNKMSERKLRLFAVACVRRIWDVMLDVRSHHAIEVAERSADQLVSDEELARVSEEADKAYVDNLFNADDARMDALNAASCISSPGREYWGQFGLILQGVCRASFEVNRREHAAQAARLRDIVGNPFRPVTFDPDWQTSTVLSLAQAAYDQRELPAGTLDPTHLAILADALQDAGCDNTDILDHCRGQGPHVRGCWVIDAILGKS